MTQEEKELLLKDISGRLPYGLIVQISLFRNDGRKTDIELDPHVTENIWEMIDKYHALPYLRPMDSMMKKETKELFKEIGFKFTCNTCGIPAHYIYEFAEQIKGIPTITNVEFIKVIDWLNAHHFDYRGLIEKGLALEAPEGMYN